MYIAKSVKEVSSMKLELVIDDRLVKFNMSKELSISSNDFEVVLSTHTEQFMFWCRVHREHRVVLNSLKEDMKDLEADSFIAVKGQLDEDGTEYFGHKLIDSLVRRLPQIKKIRKEVLELEDKVADMYNIVKAMEQRGSMITQLGAHIRAELVSSTVLVNMNRKVNKAKAQKTKSDT